MKIYLVKLWNSKRKLGNGGFTIAESMIALGILGIIIMGLLSQQRLSVKGTVEANSETEMNNLVKQITAEIGVQSVCTLNFGGKAPTTAGYAGLQRTAGPLNVLNSIVEVAALPNPKTYGTGQGQVLISDIRTVQVSDFEMKLVLEYYKKDASEVKNPLVPDLLDRFLKRKSSREIPLNITMNAGLVVNCYGNYDQMIRTAIELSCTNRSNSTIPAGEVAGTYYDPNVNPPYGGCVHNVRAINCPDGTFLKRVNASTKPASPTVPNPTNSGNEFICESITQSCPAGQYLKGFNASGTPTCETAYPMCNPGEILVFLNSGQIVCKQLSCPGTSGFSGWDPVTGNIRCNTIPAQKTCDPGNYATQVTDGATACAPALLVGGTCPAGQMIQGINSDGSIYCSQFMQLPATCPDGQAIYGFDSNGYRMCKQIRRPLSCYGYANNHSYYDCAASGGSIRNAEQVSSMCAFNGGGCPGGWTRCNTEGQQTSNYCVDVSNTGYCNPYVAARWAYAPGGDWAWVSSGQPGNTCYTFYGYPGTGHNCYQTAYTNVYTTQQTVGCY